MDCFEQLCHVCFKVNCNLQNMCSLNDDMLIVKDTFALCVPEINLRELTSLFICDNCCDILRSIHRFRELCIKNIKMFNKFVQLPDSEQRNLQQTEVNQNLKPYKVSNESEWYPLYKNEDIANTFQVQSTIKSEDELMNTEEERFEMATDSNTTDDKLKLRLIKKKSNKSSNEMNDADSTEKYSEKVQQTQSTSGTSSTDTKTDIPEEEYSCQYCNKRFRALLLLQIHICTHTDEKPHLCITCNKGFTKLSALNRHRRIHTGEKPFSCRMCDKSFTRHDHLNIHMRTHTGERPYVCGICKKGFTEISYLTKHKRTHTGEKPYMCTTCNKAFARRDNLNVHTRTNTCDKH